MRAHLALLSLTILQIYNFSQNDFAKARDGDGVNESLRTIELGPVQ